MTADSPTIFTPKPAAVSNGGVLPVGTRLMEYELLRVLGKPGGFGVTYLALDSNLDHEVAIKEYLPVDLALRTPEGQVTVRSEEDQPAFAWGLRCFLNEARLLARFNHPNVVHVHRLFEANGTAYIVMEYVRGRSLGEELRGRRISDRVQMETLLVPLLDGLQTVHGAGVLHRDLKPENILLRDDATPVLIDFGAARGAIGNRSRSLMSVLTAGYAPIEQYSQNGNQGPWTDIYALGALIYRAITGHKPADAVDRLGDDPLGPLEEVVERGFDRDFLRAVDWALRVPINQRPQSVAEWRRALVGQSLAATTVLPTDPAQAPLDLDLSFEPASTTQAAPHAADEITHPLPAAAESSAEPPLAAAEDASLALEPAAIHADVRGRPAPDARARRWPWIAGGLLAATALLLAIPPTVPDTVAEPATKPVGSSAHTEPPPPLAAAAAVTSRAPSAAAPGTPPQAASAAVPRPASPAPAAAPDAPPKPVAPKPAIAPRSAPAPLAQTPQTPPVPAKPAPASSSTPPPAGFAGMLDAHNRVRLQAGAPVLGWSAANAGEAQHWADRLAQENCRLRFNPDAARKAQYRDNLFQAYASAPYKGWRRTSEQVIERWSEGRRLYDPRSARCLQAGGGCSQYAQMVAVTARNVGCARARCEAAEVWVCTYSPTR